MRTPFIGALTLCLIGVALEGIFAGSGIQQRLKELRSPSYSVPFWGWICIGGIYYVICFVLSYRLFDLPFEAGRMAALALLVIFMFVNALWNYFFFRSRNLFHAFLLGLAYSIVALSLFLFLFLQVDRRGAWWLLPYLLYLLYANTWGYRLWSLNRQ